MDVPTIFIVGAPKCGTTALYHWLSTHPQISMSRPKEPQFFAEDVCGHQRNIIDLDSYIACFKHASKSQQLGEASTCYLVSASAPEKLKAFSPQAKIIVMLRNPVDVMYAEHNERLLGRFEQIRDFGAALDSDAVRTWKAGPFRGEQVIRPSYLQIVQFTVQLQRYFQTFTRDRVHVIVYDDLLLSAADVYRDVLAFLGLENDQRAAFNHVNVNKRARSAALQGFIGHPSGRLRSITRLVIPRRTRQNIARLVERLNLVEEPRAPLDFCLRRRLAKEVEPDVHRLSILLGRDLSSWCTD